MILNGKSTWYIFLQRETLPVNSCEMIHECRFRFSLFGISLTKRGFPDEWRGLFPCGAGLRAREAARDGCPPLQHIPTKSEMALDRTG
jgi:hypothetical protein